MLKLHLGCGKRYLRGWTHIDIADFDHIDVRTSIDDLSALSDSIASHIYSSHALEYLDRLEAGQALKEWYRVLIPDGWLHLAVPDFAALLKIYAMSSNLDTILGPLFGRLTVGETQNRIYHKTVWDEQSLRNLLVKSGFKNIDTYDPIVFLKDQSGGVEFDDHSLAFYPHMNRNGIQVSLCLRAQSVK